MSSTTTLVLSAAPGSGAVTDEVVQRVLAMFGLSAAHTRWLAPGDAWEATPDLDEGTSELRAAAQGAVASLPIDVNIVPGAPEERRKRLLCADMESTIIEQELIDEIAGLVGCHAEISAITAAAMRGELDFEGSLVKRVALFAGLDAQRLAPLLDRVTLMPGAEALIATMRAHGARCALISGGFTIFAEQVAERVGFDAVVANVLEIESGRLTGRVKEPIVGPQGKADALRRLAAGHGLDAVQTLAVGDGANDVAMLAAAGLGVAYRAKPILADRARALASGAVVTHGDLTALLHLQGYARGEFRG